MQFIEDRDTVRILTDDDGVLLTSAQFYQFEPAAPPLPAGMLRRFWSPQLSYLNDGISQSPNPGFSAEVYCQKVGTYQDLLSVSTFTFSPVIHEDLLTTDDTIIEV